MTGQFGLDDGGLHPMSEIHGEVADGLRHLTGTDIPTAGDIPQTFGHIASSMHQALGGVLDSRGGTFQATQRSSDVIAGHLRQAHDMYMGTDETGAHDITTASGAHADGGNGDGRFGGGLGQASNGFHDARSTPVDQAGMSSAGTSIGGSSGTPAGASSHGADSIGAAPLSAVTAAAAAVPTSTQDSPGGIGNAASIGQFLGPEVSQTSQQTDPTGQDVAGMPHTPELAPQQVTDSAAPQSVDAGSAGHGAVGAAAQSVQALGHRPETPEHHDVRVDGPPEDDGDPEHDPEHDPDDQPPPDDQQADGQQPPAPPPAPPLPPAAHRQSNGRAAQSLGEIPHVTPTDRP